MVGDSGYDDERDRGDIPRLRIEELHAGGPDVRVLYAVLAGVLAGLLIMGAERIAEIVATAPVEIRVLHKICVKDSADAVECRPLNGAELDTVLGME